MRVIRNLALAEVALVVLLVVAAAAIRLPRLHIVPPYSDETEEALRAWAIARGEIMTLTNVDAYVGALWNYAVAGGFKVLGRGPEPPRLMALVAGALTVGFGYLVARELFGRRTGVVAAILLAGNAAHVLVNSHVAWSNCASPLFTTLAFWLLAKAFSSRTAVEPGTSFPAGPSAAGCPLPALTSIGQPTADSRQRATRALPLTLCGLTFGLALQTHPSVAAFLPGALAYALWKDRRLLLRPAAWGALALFLIGYGNVLAYNLSNGFDSLRQAQRVSREYAEGSALDAFGYASSLAGYLVLLGQTLGGGVEARYAALEYVIDPLVFVSFVLAIVGVVWTARHGEPLPLFVFVSAGFVLPILNQRWAPIMEARYLMPLMPLCIGAVAALLVHLGDRLTHRSWVAPFVATALAGAQLLGLWRYYEIEIVEGRSNSGAHQMVQLVDVQRRAREPFVIHSDLHLLPTGGGGTWAKALDFVLQLEDVRRDVSLREPDAELRACDVDAVQLWYVQQDPRASASENRAEPRHPAYWIARPANADPPSRTARAQLALRAPYVVPFRPHSLFDERVPTFDTGCD